MLFRYQKTLRKEVSFRGIGLHSGDTVSVCVEPAANDAGIVFVDESSGAHMQAGLDAVCDTRLATTLCYPNGRKVATVEHLLAALAGLGITNAVLRVTGNELPIFDGSAAPFVQKIALTGVVKQENETRWMVLNEAVRMQNDYASLVLSPFQGTALRMETLLGRCIQHGFTFNPSRQSFAESIAPSRTFARLCDAQKMLDAGMAKGGSMDSAIVFHEGQVLNSEGLRLSDESARHKILDAIGDFSLLGSKLFGFVWGYASGHTMNFQAMRTLMKNRDLFICCSFSELPCAQDDFPMSCVAHPSPYPQENLPCAPLC